jgi:hypothetical protein
MKKNFIAALLSAFVFPGLGQIYQGNKLKGGILLILVNILLLITFGLMLRGLNRIDIPAAIPDYATSARIAQQLIGGTPAIPWTTGILFCIWLYGVLDALLCNSKGHPS